jgi:hypothetical protein
MKLVLLLLLIPSVLTAQLSKRDSMWLPLMAFIGKWKGEGGGEPGKGVYERNYQFIMNKRFIEIHNKSSYQPSKEYPNGEVHQDIGYFSYDNARKMFMLRQFHTEGFVNQFKLDSISPDKKTIVFVTESIENIPAGYRAKETYWLINENEIEETFEIAEPGKDFGPYSKVRLLRQK